MSKSILACLITFFFFCQCKNDCAEIYEPVCGSDGKNYFNACQANTVRVRYTQGLCTSKTEGKVVNLGKDASTDCNWVFKIDSLEIIKNAYFSMYNLSDEFKEHNLMVEITYTYISDGIGVCSLNGMDYANIYMNVVSLKKI